MIAASPRGGWRASTGFGTRVLAFWLGLFSLVNVAGAQLHPGFDVNIWWIDLRGIPTWTGRSLLTASGVLLIAYALRPATQGLRRSASVVTIGILMVAALANTASYFQAWVAGTIAPRAPIPLSLVVVTTLGLIGLGMLRPGVFIAARRRRVVIAGAVTTLIALGFPLMQMIFFGTTDYRRAADAIVVFGARVDPGGKASVALADRVATASELYREGLAPTVVMSGGIEPSGYDETVVMRDLAERQGVPSSAIVLDPGGTSTSATVDDTARMFRRDDTHRVLAVSQFYHLTRIKLAYARAGFDVWTVPSKDTAVWQTPVIVGREIPAFWLYYLRATLT